MEARNPADGEEIGVAEEGEGIETPRGNELILWTNDAVIRGNENGDGVEELPVEDDKEKMEGFRSLVPVEDKPPVDDCCPICFGPFTAPCKTSCGHWFCANCILQFWNYKATVQQCKCPMCCQLISKLTPEASLLLQQEEEVIKALKNVQKYNCLFLGGPYGLMMKALQLPVMIKRIIHALMDPDRFRLNYYRTRFVALVLSFLYNISFCDFIPTGGLGVGRLFDLCAIALVVTLCLVGVCYRAWLRYHTRRLAAPQLLDG